MAAPLVFEAMGTVVSVRVAGGVPDALGREVVAAFAGLEGRFSLYRPESEAAAVARREALVRHASPEFRRVYDLALDWRAATDGAFTPHRPDGVIDLSGIVKALAVAAAGAVLDAAGATSWSVNAGGDVLVSGDRPDGRPWVVGVVDPDDRTALLSQYTSPGGRRAVATSGTAERGEHVWRTGADATFHQVTVVADDIVAADVLATAILAGGPDALARAQRAQAIEVLACAADGRFWASPAFRA
nr:FAD:protein FMN transferase [Propionibacterium sp.]